MKVYVVWNDGDYYGPDAADSPWIFDTEQKARDRIDALIETQGHPGRQEWGQYNQPRARGFFYYDEVEVARPHRASTSRSWSSPPKITAS